MFCYSIQSVQRTQVLDENTKHKAFSLFSKVFASFIEQSQVFEENRALTENPLDRETQAMEGAVYWIWCWRTRSGLLFLNGR